MNEYTYKNINTHAFTRAVIIHTRESVIIAIDTEKEDHNVQKRKCNIPKKFTA